MPGGGAGPRDEIKVEESRGRRAYERASERCKQASKMRSQQCGVNVLFYNGILMADITQIFYDSILKVLSSYRND